MLNYPNINNIALQLGVIKIHWYGIMYLLGFAIAWVLAKIQAKKLKYNWDNEILNDFIFYCAIGGILGGRLGYVLFYGLTDFFHNPLFVFEIWKGGMSFHGGMIGVFISLFLFAKKIKMPFLAILDFTAPLVPPGIALGRIGNFINAELLGRVTTCPWGIIFPNGGPLPRHPSQLYEALAEGLLLFVAIKIYAAKPRPRGRVTALFLLLYCIARFICEFFREPDQHIGFIAANWLTLGQLLCLPIAIIAIIMLLLCKKKN
jgi:phosphatidylglycerol---prolipoprotein diacylglyceryl transferase